MCYTRHLDLALLDPSTCYPFQCSSRTNLVSQLLNSTIDLVPNLVFCSIIRITSLIIFFSIIAWLSIEFEGQAIYLTPLFVLYESFCFASFFLLLCAWISPDPAERDRYFQNIESRKNDQVKEGGHLRWYHVCLPAFDCSRLHPMS